MITGTDITKVLELAAESLIAMRDQLNELDAAMGDGDCGLTAEKGANGLKAYLAQNPADDNLGKWLAKAGMAYNKAAPSTMGALMATALMRAGKEVMGKAELEDNDIGKMLKAASLGIQERGKAKVGDKTIVDALDPAADAMQAALENGENLETAAKAALLAAQKGRDSVIEVRSMIGRANWVGDKTKGKVDPGTVLFVGMLESILNQPPSQPGSTLH